MCQHSASHCCNAVLPTCISYSCIPADVFCSDTLYVHTDPDGHRALLKSAGSGTDHRIHITNLKATYALSLRQYIGFPESLCVHSSFCHQMSHLRNLSTNSMSSLFCCRLNQYRAIGIALQVGASTWLRCSSAPITASNRRHQS